MKPTVVARLAWVQTLVTVCALALVVLLTWAGLSAILAWKTDRVLSDLLARTTEYLDAGPTEERVDWGWLAAEIDEARPRDIRFEVRERAGSRTLITLGSGRTLGTFEPGCKDRGAARVCGSAGRRYVAIAASDRRDDLAARNQLMLALALACVLAGAGVALASAAVTRRALAPLSDLAMRVAAIEPGSGTLLEPTAKLRELEVLERRFADLVERFEQALLREKQFTAHASHELRTPLTLARAEIEAIDNPTGTATALAALSRLQALIEALLWFARAQGRLDADDMDVVNLADILAQQVSELRLAHASRLIADRLPDEALVRGDEQLLASTTGNLLENAVKYGEESEIEVELTREGQQLVVRITNGGQSIPEKLREEIFVPFVRGAHSVSGFGLGLAFARAVARAHGGDLTLGALNTDRTTMVLRLPLVGWYEEAMAS